MTNRESGAALILALLTAGLLAALGVSVLLVTDTERGIASNAARSSESLAAADAALERAMVDLRLASGWNTILAGRQHSAFSEQTRRPSLPFGGTLDLDAATADVQAETMPPGVIGPDTPVWRLFAWGPLARMAAPGAIESLQYVVVWIADDLSETDADPDADSNGIVMLHAEARGPAGARRVVEATVSRAGAGAVKVITWREVR